MDIPMIMSRVMTLPNSDKGLERVSTGVSGLDELIEGGFPKGRTITVTGGPGVGKSILAIHYIYEACKRGEKTILLATEETPEEIKEQASQIGKPFDKFEEDELLIIIPALRERMKEVEWRRGKTSPTFIFKNPIEIIETQDADNIIIDNLGVYTVDVSIGTFRNQMDYLVNTIRSKKMTSVLVCDETVDERYSRVALYSVHGAIELFKRENPFTGNVERLINVVKMRGSKTPLEYIRYSIDHEGIKVLETAKQ